MSYLGKSLASGAVTASQADIYAVPSGKTAIIKTLTVYNTGASSETVKVYIKQYGETARQIGIAVLAQDESKQFIGQAVTLSSEDSLQAITTSATDFSITGAIQ